MVVFRGGGKNYLRGSAKQRGGPRKGRQISNVLAKAKIMRKKWGDIKKPTPWVRKQRPTTTSSNVHQFKGKQKTADRSKRISWVEPLRQKIHFQ